MFARILTLIALLLVAAANAQGSDDQVLEAYQAYKEGNRAKLTELLP